MAVRLRLRREGTKKKPHYRVVAADKRAPRNGKFIEILGEYHPLDDPSTIKIDHERALHWLRHGAQPSSQVEKLLRIVGVWEEFKPGDEPKRDRSQQDKPKLSKKAKAKKQEAAEAGEDAAAQDAKADAEAKEAAAAEADEDAKAEAEATEAAAADADAAEESAEATESDDADTGAEDEEDES